MKIKMEIILLKLLILELLLKYLKRKRINLLLGLGIIWQLKLLKEY